MMLRSTSAWMLLCLSLLNAAARGATPCWTWSQGHNYRAYHGNYGIKGSSATNPLVES